MKLLDKFEAFTVYSTENGFGTDVRNNAFCCFVIAVQKAVEARNSPNISAKALVSIANDLHNDEQMRRYFAIAEQQVQDAAKEALEIQRETATEFQKAMRESAQAYEQAWAKLDKTVSSRRRNRFWVSVAASAVGSLVFAMFVPIVFWVMKSQFDAWQAQLASNMELTKDDLRSIVEEVVEEQAKATKEDSMPDCED